MEIMKKLLIACATASIFLAGGLLTPSAYAANWWVTVVAQYNQNKFTGAITNYHAIRSKSIPVARYSVSAYSKAAGGGWNYTTLNEYKYYKNTATGRIYGP